MTITGSSPLNGKARRKAGFFLTRPVAKQTIRAPSFPGLRYPIGLDMTRAKAFYETLFERSLEKLGSGAPGIAEMWALPGSPHEAGATGALVKMEGGPEGGGTIVYFVCW